MQRNLANITLAMAIALGSMHYADAQPAGTQPPVIAALAARSDAQPWIVDKESLGLTLYDGGGNTIGRLVGLNMGRDGRVLSAIVDAGTYLGSPGRDVIIPADRIGRRDGRIVIAVRNRNELRSMSGSD